jgi:hypothetical protein
MKFRRREKQLGVRLRSDQHAALREIAEHEGYESVSEFGEDALLGSQLSSKASEGRALSQKLNSEIYYCIRQDPSEALNLETPKGIKNRAL